MFLRVPLVAAYAVRTRRAATARGQPDLCWPRLVGHAVHSPLAVVSPRADIAEGCTIGPFTVVHDNVRLGPRSVVGSHCILGEPTPLADGKRLDIGADALIRSHSVFYEGTTIGPHLVTGHRVTVREKLVAGTNLQIGTLSDFQGHARIGDYTRTHSNVHIGHASTVGNYVWIFPYVVLTNDPHPPSEVRLGVTVEDYAAIGTMSTIMPGVRVGTRSLVAAQSMVNKDVAPDTVVGGVPAKFLCPTSAVKDRRTGEPAYPWTRHFHRGYPPEKVAEWRRQAGGPAEGRA